MCGRMRSSLHCVKFLSATFQCPWVVWRYGWSADLSFRRRRSSYSRAYLRFLQNELPRILEYVSLNKRGRIYFQNDGVPPRFSREVRNFLNDHYLGRCIGRGGLHNWPARSPDLSPLDYCVWGWMKEMTHRVRCFVRSHFGCGRTAWRTFSGSYNEQGVVSTNERRDASRLKVVFSKSSFKHNSV